MTKINTGTREVIVGCAYNYKTPDILPFLNSLKQIEFTGELILLINDKSAIDTSLFPFKTTCFNADEEFSKFRMIINLSIRYSRKGESLNIIEKLLSTLVKKRIRRNKNISKWMAAYFYFSYYIQNSRFFLYYYLLFEKEASSVLFTDVSDVFFQGNPFNLKKDNCIYAFAENENVRLGEEKFNSAWIRKGFGSKVLEKLRRSPIYCSGTIIANKSAIFHFLSDFIIVNLDYKVPPMEEGIDQGVFNFMTSYLHLPYIITKSNGEHVFTMGLYSDEEIMKNGGKLYLAGKTDFVPSIIHQFNRHSGKTDEIINRLCRGNDVAQFPIEI